MPAVASPIVTLAQARLQLNYNDPAVTTDDAEITTFVAAASQMIVNRTGPIAGSPTVDEWHDGGSTDILLRTEGPIQSVTTVTESFGSVVYTLTQVTLDSGSVTTPFGFTVDLDAALLVRRAAGAAIAFASGEANIHITYVAGYAVTPPDITQACLVLLQHLWETQRGGGVRPGRGPLETVGFSMPNRVMETLEPYIVPGIA